VLWASGGEGGTFHIVYARLAYDRLLLGKERPVVTSLLREHPYSLFVFSNEAQDRWHFLNVKFDEDSAKRQLFRRITVGPEERFGKRLRTATDRLEMLDLEKVKDQPPLAIQSIHDDAFDVEVVTKKFFKVFADLYHKVADDIARTPGLKQEAGKHAQLLLDRLIFLYFVQKKGWLNQNPNYLHERFSECWKKDSRGHSFYPDVLYPLFLCLSDPDIRLDDLGSIPFLNGGLFEESAQQSQAEKIIQARLQIRNSTFKAIFDDLLEAFNFMVTEDTPLDVEVAIDPEMLGKIFESLILELEKDPEKDLRKLTGSYYTPRPIVHFMCQEALKEYLVTQLASDDTDKTEDARVRVAALLALPPADHLDEEQAERLKERFTPTEAKALRQAILDCRVCDPAVGSGAFPVGMLHEMVAAVGRLDLRIYGNPALEVHNYNYDLKRRIIESCLYGVDIQEQAVRLCELRLWLSLVVDYQIDPDKPFPKAIREVPSLPNLSYRIMRGDSLLERLFGQVVQLDRMADDARTKQIIESIQADKVDYFREGDTAEKRRLELKILAKQTGLAERLIEAKRAALTARPQDLFGEESKRAKDRKARAVHDAQVAELADLKTKVAEARKKVEALTNQKYTVRGEDINALRRRYFRTGEHPTFIWKVDFAEVFAEKGGFDIVIANPPYGVKVSIDERGVLDAKFAHNASQTKNSAIYFTYIGEALLRPAGVVSLIVPKSLVYSVGWQKCASVVAVGLQKLVDTGKAFERVKLEQVIFIRTPSRDTNCFTNGLYDGSMVREMACVQKQTVQDYGVLLCGQTALEMAVIEKVVRNSEGQFGERVSIRRGLNWQSKVINYPGRTPIYRGAQLQPYFLNKATDFISLNAFPREAYEYQFRPKILNQLAIAHVQNPYPHFFLQASLDLDNRLVFETISCTFLKDNSADIKFVLGFNNSKIFAWLLYKLIYSNAIRSTRYDEQYVGRLPWPKASSKSQVAIVSAVDGILKLTGLADYQDSIVKQIRVAEYKDEIDAKCYELFSLNPEEIAIVEGKEKTKCPSVQV